MSELIPCLINPSTVLLLVFSHQAWKEFFSGGATTLPRQWLTPAEMAQRRTDGLCYNSDEKFAYGHKCKCVFVLEVLPEDIGEEEEWTTTHW
jgi:hypothetical protein